MFNKAEVSESVASVISKTREERSGCQCGAEDPLVLRQQGEERSGSAKAAAFSRSLILGLLITSLFASTGAGNSKRFSTRRQIFGNRIDPKRKILGTR